MPNQDENVGSRIELDPMRSGSVGPPRVPAARPEVVRRRQQVSFEMREWDEIEHANDCLALLYRRLGDEEIMVVPQLFNAVIRRGRYMDSGWEHQW